MKTRLRLFSHALAFGVAAAVALGAPARAADPPLSDADALALVKSVAADLRAGKIDRSRLTPAFAALLDGPRLAILERPFDHLSQPLQIVQDGRTEHDGETTRVFVANAADGVEYVTLGIDDATGKISALYARPGPPR